MAKSLAQLRAAFTRAERARVQAARDYANMLELYRYQRGRARQEVYELVKEAYQAAWDAYERREQTVEALDAWFEEDEGEEYEPEFEAGTEFEFTAVTEGGTPGTGK